MTSFQPEYCRPEAYDLFRAQLEHLDETDGLVTAALAVSMHALDDVKPEAIASQMDALADRVLQRARSRKGPALLAHLHEVLFDEERFRGNTNNYYSCLNSYLPTVLESREGIPLTLSLVYKAVGERVGLAVEGINSPGHFLAQVTSDGDTMIVDPFNQGRLLTTEEAYQWLRQVTGQNLCAGPDLLAIAEPQQWIDRLLRNLQGIFARDNHNEDLAAMNELLHLLRNFHCNQRTRPDEDSDSA